MQHSLPLISTLAIAFGQYFENQFINVNARGGVAAAGINKFTTEGIGDTATTADYRGLRLR